VDKHGNYTDLTGSPLTVGARVRVSADYNYDGPKEGTGAVVSLPKEGSDWYGFPVVRFDDDDKTRHVPDSALRRTDPEPGSLVAHLEDMIATTRARNTAMETFLDAGPGVEGAPPAVPATFPVTVLGPDEAAADRATCGACGRSWDNAASTSYTPAPSGRCPFEAFHAPTVEPGEEAGHGMELTVAEVRRTTALPAQVTDADIADAIQEAEMGDSEVFERSLARLDEAWGSLLSDVGGFAERLADRRTRRAQKAR
jgi:hypothetical protein